MRERVVRVVPDLPAVHRRFDYVVPESMSADISVGSRVRVELHGRRVGGWVVEDDVTPPPGVVPKALARSSGAGPPASVVDLAAWAAWRWDGPLTSFLGTASPLRVVPPGAVRPRPHGSTPSPRRTPAPSPLETAMGEAQTGEAETTVEMAVEMPVEMPAEVASPGGGAVALVDQLLGDEAGPPDRVGQSGTWDSARWSVVRLAPALDAVLVVQELVHRTGPRGVLVLVPSLAGARAVVARLRGAGVPVVSLPGEWAAVARGEAAVAVGTRAAAWAPMPSVRAAVVVDAHDEAYREERAPTWSAVDVVIERCRRDGGRAVLVSPCPTLSLVEGARVVTTDRAVERRGWALVEPIDRTGDDPRTGLFSERMVRAVRDELGRPGGRVVCVLNRTGRVRVMACAACGALCRCTTCGAAVRTGKERDVLVCPRCGVRRPPLCAVCDSRRLRALRVGVSRATEELSTLVGVPAVELAGRPGTTAEDVTSADEARLVVGTEAALHRAGACGLVAFLDFDQHLLAPRFGAAEEALAMVVRAGRLVGGRGRGGRVLLQTRMPAHPVVMAATTADPPLVIDSERPVRHALELPPFGALAVCSGPGAEDRARALGDVPGLSVSALPDDRWLVRAPDHATLCDGLAATPRPAARLRVEVDPTDV